MFFLGVYVLEVVFVHANTKIASDDCVCVYVCVVCLHVYTSLGVYIYIYIHIYMFVWPVCKRTETLLSCFFWMNECVVSCVCHVSH